jgi:dTDP-4-amino-4,6-dideoxygalactose transaminase
MPDKSKRIFLSPPHLTGRELEFVREAFDSNYVAPVGPMVDAFEAEFAERFGFKRAIAVHSGTAAMHLALSGLRLERGDEVIASDLTFVGGASPIVLEGGVPVFIDSDRASWNMDPGLLAEELAACARRGKLPKAVIPTDIYGQCADLGLLQAACEPYGVPLIVDAAESLGATCHGRPAGNGAWAAVFSFNGNKIITTSGGGMLASDDVPMMERAMRLARQASEDGKFYEYREIGHNYRMSNVLAAIGRAQMLALDGRIQRRRAIFDLYRRLLGDVPGIEFMPEAAYGTCTRWLTVLLITPERFGATPEEVRLALEREGWTATWWT